MSNVLAGIGRGQMKVIDQRVKQRRDNFLFYKKSLSQFPGIHFQHELPGALSNRWLTCITVDPLLNRGITRETIRHALDSENIESRPLWKPMHMQPVFKEYPFYGDKTSERLFEIGLCLPSGSNLTHNDLNRVIAVFESCFKNFSKT